MKNTIIKPVSDFAEVITGGTPSTRNTEYWDGDIPWINSGALNNGDIKTASKYITELGLKNSSAKLMPKDSVLVALTGATTGQVGYLTFEASANQSVTGILPSKEHYPRYLYYYFKTQRAKIMGDAFGGAQPHINQKYVKDFKIPLPPLDDQKRIAHLLGKVEGLIARRKQHLQQLDELLKSVFLGMFGNLFLNDRNFDVFTLDEIKAAGKGTFSNGPFGSDLLTSELSETGDVPVIYIRDIRDACLMWVSNVYVTKNKALSLPNCNATIGDVLIAKVGDPPGIAAVNSKFTKAIITQDVIRLRTDTGLANPHFVQSLLNSKFGKWLIKKISIKGTRSRFPLKAFKNSQVPLPPVDLQNKFATVVEKIEGIKSHYQQSLTDLETLYGALSQKAFKGELDLSRVPLPTEGPEIAEDVKFEAKDKQPKEPLFELPEPEELAVLLQSAEGRKTLLGQWLTAWLDQLDNAPFEVQSFMETAQQWLRRLLEDEAPDWSVAEYEEIKTWIFEALEQGRLKQNYDDANNRVRITAAKG